MNCKKIKPEDGGDYKLIQSAHTATTSHCFIRKKFSLESCLSSRSIDEGRGKEKYLCQRKLFMKFLTSVNSKNHLKVLEGMHRYYRANILECKQPQILGKETPKISYMPDQYPQHYNEMMNYFCGVWLMQMGYKTDNNKNSIMQRIKLQLSTQQLYKAVSFYQLLGDGFISADERWQLVISICVNGWQILSQKIIEFCRSTKMIPSKSLVVRHT